MRLHKKSADRMDCVLYGEGFMLGAPLAAAPDTSHKVASHRDTGHRDTGHSDTGQPRELLYDKYVRKNFRYRRRRFRGTDFDLSIKGGGEVCPTPR